MVRLSNWQFTKELCRQQRILMDAGAMDYELLLRIQHGFVVSEVEIVANTPIVNQSLSRSRPWDHGVVILAVKTDGKANEGLPNASTVLHVGDVVTV